MENYEKLIKEAKDLTIKNFEEAEEAKRYAHELSQKLQEEEAKLMEKKRELDNIIYEIRNIETDVFNYWLSIKE